ncbi:HrpA-like RNA helicase [Kutzneria viridogrisea]|uniref:DUF397 domain-containing protein n=2 Tax=Kutzneria TaxID=43356 RepID=W5WJM8_9PSEU|nr:DUF397 domain-containing protein [Kutzneria albida]AHI00772.1 hypothetical protein KALB_7414 [Kutzneria albida DSM 43870]MBA8926048.1 HrpA-like RNA helicase [Kutzneria viridogrisea]
MTEETAPIYDDKSQVRGALDLTGAQWRVSRFAVPEDANVEIAEIEHTDGVTYTVMRNAAHPDGPVLVFTPGEWTAFIGGARLGEFEWGR